MSYDQMEYLGNNVTVYSLKGNAEYVYTLFKKKFYLMVDADLLNLEGSYSNEELVKSKIERLKELYKWTETYYSGEKF
jgi:hypothetical protein